MLRKILFWTHLVAGIAAGLAILIMSATGAVLTFEKELIAWAERDARTVSPPSPSAPRLPLNELITRAQAAKPTTRFSNLTVSIDPTDAVLAGTPGNQTFGLNPYTGEVREAAAPRMRAFMQSMRSWHTHLAVNQPGPANWGSAINAAANVAFVLLCVTGLIIWWPRVWQWRTLRPIVWFSAKAAGRARDWNWHNVFGIWALPVLIVLAGTGIVLSYRWANEAMYRLAGETLPARPAPPAPPPKTTGAPPGAPPAPAEARPRPATPTAAPAPSVASDIDADARLARVQATRPDWQTITLRFSPPIGAPKSNQPAPKNFSANVKERDVWPVFGLTNVTLDVAGVDNPRIETFENLSSGTRARRWVRLLHSGEALGRVVQVLSALACLAACLLVYTGFALAWRRFFGRPASAPSAP